MGNVVFAEFSLLRVNALNARNNCENIYIDTIRVEQHTVCVYTKTYRKVLYKLYQESLSTYN